MVFLDIGYGVVDNCQLVWYNRQRGELGFKEEFSEFFINFFKEGEGVLEDQK